MDEEQLQQRLAWLKGERKWRVQRGIRINAWIDADIDELEWRLACAVEDRTHGHDRPRALSGGHGWLVMTLVAVAVFMALLIYKGLTS